MYVYVCETYQLNARKVATASTTLCVPVNWLAVYAGPNMYVCMYVYICIGVCMCIYKNVFMVACNILQMVS